MSNLTTGDAAIDFSLPGVDGKTHALSDFSDKKLLAVIFSCNHCPYVQAWEDRMIAIQEQYADQGFQIVAISSNDENKYASDSFPEMKVRAEEKGFNFPYLYDEPQTIAAAYGAERTPEVFLFDGDRKLKYHGAIDDNYEEPENVSEAYLRDAIEALLNDKTPATQSTPPVGCTIKWKS